MIGHGRHQSLADALAAEDGRLGALIIVAESDGLWNASGSLTPELLPRLIRCLRHMANEFEEDLRMVIEDN